MFQSILTTHLFSALISFTLLAIKGRMQLKEQNWRAVKLLKILPHISDTLLILSGIGLLWLSHIGFTWWIILKIGLLVEYIIFSIKYFSRSNENNQNKNAFYLALMSLSGAILLGFYH